MVIAAILTIILCLGLPGSAPAADQPLTLGEAQLLALKHNPGLKAAGMTVETAEAEMARARGPFSPEGKFRRDLQFFRQPLPGLHEQTE